MLYLRQFMTKCVFLVVSSFTSASPVPKMVLSPSDRQLLIVQSLTILKKPSSARFPVLTVLGKVPPLPKVSSQFRKLICYGAKLGFCIGLTQLTISQGLWGTCEESEALAKRLGLITRAAVEGKIKEKLVKKQRQFGDVFKSKWNMVVIDIGKSLGLDP